MKEQILRAGRRIRKMIGEETYQRLLLTDATQRFLQFAGLTGLPSPKFSEIDLAQLDHREVEAALSLAVLWVYDSRIEGDIVEFGTGRGFSAQVIASAMAVGGRSLPRKKLHLFDSFEGFPEAT